MRSDFIYSPKHTVRGWVHEQFKEERSVSAREQFYVVGGGGRKREANDLNLKWKCYIVWSGTLCIPFFHLHRQPKYSEQFPVNSSNFLREWAAFFLCCFSSHPITMMFLWRKSLFSRALFFVLGLRATRQFIGYGFLMISRPLFHSAFRLCPLFFCMKRGLFIELLSGAMSGELPLRH